MKMLKNRELFFVENLTISFENIIINQNEEVKFYLIKVEDRRRS